MCKYNLTSDFLDVETLINEARKRTDDWRNKYKIPEFKLLKTEFSYIGADKELKKVSCSNLVCIAMPKGENGETFFVFAVKQECGYNYFHSIVISEKEFNNSIKIIK